MIYLVIAGVVQAFETLVLTGHPELSIFVKVAAILLTIGVLAQVSSWIVSPTEGLHFVAQKGLLQFHLFFIISI